MRLLVALVLLGAAACTSGGTADPAGDDYLPEAPRWVERWGPDPAGLLLSAWGGPGGDIFAVGGTQSATLVVRYDGEDVETIDNPGDRLAWWVFGLDGELWVVGERGLILARGTGGVWADESVQTSQTLFGIWGTARDDLYVVGGSYPNGHAFILHRDAAGWTEMPIPSEASAHEALFKIWGSGPEDVFAVGEGGTILHRDDSGTWTLMDTPSGAPLFTVSGRGPTDVWAVGGRASGAVWRYDGKRWCDVTPPDTGVATHGLNGVFAGPLLAVQIVGAGGFHLTYDGALWSAPTPATTELLHGVWCGLRCVAVGGTLLGYPTNTRGVMVELDPALEGVVEPDVPACVD